MSRAWTIRRVLDEECADACKTIIAKMTHFSGTTDRLHHNLATENYLTTGKLIMEKTRIVSQKRVHGEVESNDGEFAEIQTVSEN
ncbi:MAG: hypothetical protein WB762_07160 [Candidatus Sulfotelmatobacter sp.]